MRATRIPPIAFWGFHRQLRSAGVCLVQSDAAHGARQRFRSDRGISHYDTGCDRHLSSVRHSGDPSWCDLAADCRLLHLRLSCLCVAGAFLLGYEVCVFTMMTPCAASNPA